MRKILCLLMIVGVLLATVGCGTKTLICDNCKKEVKVSKDSNMNDEWTMYCEDCQKELFGDKTDEK